MKCGAWILGALEHAEKMNQSFHGGKHEDITRVIVALSSQQRTMFEKRFMSHRQGSCLSFLILYLSNMTRGEARLKMESTVKTFWNFSKKHGPCQKHIVKTNGHAKNTWAKGMVMLKTHGLMTCT